MRCIAVLIAIAPGLLLAQKAPSFERDVRPIIETYCARCHGPRTKKGGVDLAAARDAGALRRNATVWRTAAAHIEGRFMPPSKAKQPTTAERQRAVRAIEALLRHTDHGTTPTLRRLNAFEYTNTVRTLLGTSVDPKKLPTDAASHGFDNVGDGLFVSPLLLERYYELTKQVVGEALESPETRTRFLGAAPSSPQDAGPSAERALAPFMRAAFRRPATTEEIEARVRIVTATLEKGESWQAGMRAALESVLLSPHFLFRVEPEPTEGPTRPLTPHEVAARLSYFLISDTPDADLSTLADEGRLADPDVVAAQARRLLTSPASRALADGFAAQWLGFREVLDKTIDFRRFGRTDAPLRRHMYEESARTFDAIVREGRPVTELIDADSVLINGPLAKIYGIKGVRGDGFRRVPVDPRQGRGGMLGMASILTMTSYPLRTSPVVRGKWVLEALLGTPPAPPPADAGGLPGDDKQKDGLTFRERLLRHRAEPRCASCHATMDPLGFALENFDGVGRWRNKIHGKPIDTASELPDGTRLASPADVKALLLGRTDAFVRTMAERLFVYAVGRPVTPTDRELVDRMVSACAGDGYRFSALVEALVRSRQFLVR